MADCRNVGDVFTGLCTKGTVGEVRYRMGDKGNIICRRAEGTGREIRVDQWETKAYKEKHDVRTKGTENGKVGVESAQSLDPPGR